MSAVDPGPTLHVFAYEAQTLRGEPFTGTLEAASAEEAQHRLASLQLRVLTLGPAAPAKPRTAALGADEFLIFNQQLAHLAQAGLPIEKGLRLIALDLRSGRLARAADSVAAELERGDTLLHAFALHAAQFPPLYGQLVQAGATSGNLPGMLFNLGRHLELVGRLRRCLWRTLAYPVAVLAALSFVFLFVSLYVLPPFKDIFSDFRTTLPKITEIILDVGRVYPYLFIAAWALVLLVILGDLLARLAGTRGIPWINLLTYVPILGRILRANILARFLDAFRIALDSGLDLPHALALAANATGESPLIRDVAVLTDQLQRGLPIARFRSHLIPATVPAAIELASSTGSGAELPQIVYTLSHMYQEQAEHRLRLLPSILTPIFLIIIAGGVSITVGAMFLPLVKLVQSVSGGEP